MHQMTSPQGEVLSIPTEGVPAMVALGWEPMEPAESKPKGATRAPAKRAPRAKADTKEA